MNTVIKFLTAGLICFAVANNAFCTLTINRHADKRYWNGFMDDCYLTYDTYTRIVTVSPYSGSTVVKNTERNCIGRLAAASGVNDVHGIIFEEGITDIITSIADMFALCLWYANVPEFIYIPSSCGYMNLTYGRAKWLFIMNRNTTKWIMGFGSTDPNHYFTNCVFHGIAIDGADGYTANGTLSCVDTIYCSDRAKTYLSTWCQPDEITYRNLTEIPYLKLFEDIKHKIPDAVYDQDHYIYQNDLRHRPHHVSVPPEKTVLSSTPATSKFYLMSDYCLEVDPISKTVYVSTIDADGINHSVLDDLEATHLLYYMFDTKNVVFMPGVTSWNVGAFLTSAHLKCVYTPKGMVTLNSLNAFGLAGASLDVGIFSDKISISNPGYGRTPYNNMLFLGGVPNLHEESHNNETVVYSKSVLDAERVNKPLEAFDMLKIIKAFNDVKDFEQFKIQHSPSNLSLTKYVTLEEERTVETVSDSMTFSIHPLNIPYTVTGMGLRFDPGKPAPVVLARRDINKYDVFPTDYPNGGSIVIKANLPGGVEHLIETAHGRPVINHTGVIGAVDLYAQGSNGEFKVTGRHVSSEGGSSIYFTPRWRPEVLTPASIGWKVTAPDGGIVQSSSVYEYQEDFYYKYEDSEAGNLIEVTVDGLRAQTVVGPVYVDSIVHVPVPVNDTTHIPVSVNDTTHIPVTAYDTTHIPVTVNDTTRIPVSVNDTVYGRIIVYLTDTVWTTEYKTEYSIIFVPLEIKTDIYPFPEETKTPFLYRLTPTTFQISSPYDRETLYFYNISGELADKVIYYGGGTVQTSRPFYHTIIAVSDKGWYQIIYND